MDIGFAKAGFKTIWANEYDKTIAPSYQNYFPESKFDGRSILDIPNEDIPFGATGITLVSRHVNHGQKLRLGVELTI